MSEIVLRQVEKQMMVASDSHGHSVVIGRSPDERHEWIGMKASDLLLVAIAACASYDVVDILTKQREPFSDLKVVCNGDQMSDPPYTFTAIHLHYALCGAVKPEKLERAIRLSIGKYCSVISTLRADTPVTFDFEIIDRME
jgi:putative redox protein